MEDLSHAPCTDGRDDLIRSEASTGTDGHRLSGNDGRIVTDLLERFVQSRRGSISAVEHQRLEGGCAAYHKSNVVAATRMAILVEKDFLTGSGRNVGRRRRR